MPAQQTVSGVAYYSENDTEPALLRQLLHGDDTPIDLTDAIEVAILMSYSRYSHYYSPFPIKVDRASCDIQDAPNGWVSWTPQVGDLSPPGPYDYVFEITWAGGGVQTVPANTVEKLIVTTKPGGQMP